MPSLPRETLPRETARRAIGLRWIACLAAAALLAAGCSKKLSSGGGALDALVYDLLGMDRGTAYYYDVVHNAHDKRTFAYKVTADPYLADKCVDAIVHLGSAHYTRLEGEVQVVVLLSDVLAEDPSALARNVAAGSLTRLALALSPAPAPAIPERGDRIKPLLQEVDGFHDESGRRRDASPATKARIVEIMDEFGRFELSDPILEKDSLRWFPTRAYVVNETDPDLREAYDQAMVRRSRALIASALEGAVLDPVAHVRQAAVQGLKTLVVSRSVDTMAERAADESHPWVRAEIAEYFGAVGGQKASMALLPLLDDVDGTVRHRARVALSRIAGADYGPDPATWKSWAEHRYPAAVSAAPREAAPASGGTR